jgi:hypothetical protein
MTVPSYGYTSFVAFDGSSAVGGPSSAVPFAVEIAVAS